MMKQAIEECGYQPGVDVAIALDPALSELEIAYREEFDVPDSIGMYLFWRDHSKKVMDRDAILASMRKPLVNMTFRSFPSKTAFPKTISRAGACCWKNLAIGSW